MPARPLCTLTFASVRQAPAFGAPKKNAPKEFAYGLPGGSNILGEFDPAGFMEGKPKLEVYRLREAELAHGRVSMLASLGFLVQEKFHPLFSGDGGPAIDQIPQLPYWLWIAMTIGIGRAELFRIQKGWAKLNPETGKAESALKEGYMPGDLGFDPLNLKPEDPAECASSSNRAPAQEPQVTVRPTLQRALDVALARLWQVPSHAGEGAQPLPPCDDRRRGLPRAGGRHRPNMGRVLGRRLLLSSRVLERLWRST